MKVESKLYQHCQELWKKAYHEPQTMSFKNKREAFRAKFTMYDAVRKYKKEGNGPRDLMLAMANCEICMGKDDLSIVIQNRQENPFYNNMIGQLEELTNLEVVEPVADITELDVEASLAKLQVKTGKPKGQANKYFNREDL